MRSSCKAPSEAEAKSSIAVESFVSGRLEWRQSARDGEGRVVRDLVRRLLVRDTTQRLGCMKRAGLDVMEHKFYQTINWEEVVERKLEPPLRPRIEGEADTSNFLDYSDEDNDREEADEVPARLLAIFDEF